jgi:hypothetical protein
MKKYLMRLWICFMLSVPMTTLVVPSCAPTVPTPIVNVIPPKVQSDVTPQTQKIVATNQALQKTVQTQKASISEQTNVIIDALATAEDLRKQLQGTAPEVMATNLITQLDGVKTRNMFIEGTNAELQKQIDEQRVIADDAVAKAMMKDQESREWQSNNLTKDSIIAKIGSERDSAMKERDSAKITAAKAGVYKFWVIALIGAFAGWTILKNVLMIYFPLAKFRV